jgi:hypothetical protein
MSAPHRSHLVASPDVLAADVPSADTTGVMIVLFKARGGVLEEGESTPAL